MDYNFEEFKRKAMIKFLKLEDYQYIQNNLETNLSKNRDFQRTFNRLYRVRKDDCWQKVFYTYFEKVKKDSSISFAKILDYIYENTHTIEVSFASKLLATIQPNMPIWDRYVLKNLKQELEEETKEKRLVHIRNSSYEICGKNDFEKLENAKRLYEKLIKIEEQKLKEKKVYEEIQKFKKDVEEYKLTDQKILDCFLWQNRN